MEGVAPDAKCSDLGRAFDATASHSSAGRKPLLLFSTVAMAVAILALTVALTHPGRDWTPPFAVLSVVAFVCSFGVGMGPVPWLLPAELFPSDQVTRAHAHAARPPTS